MIEPVEKYNYYVERLLLNNPTPEPTEYYAPTPSPIQPILSPCSDKLQYIMGISITTSIITTYFVIFVSYYCVIFRAKLKRRYLRSIAASSSSSSSYSGSSSDSSTSSENTELSGNEGFAFEDIYGDNAANTTEP